MGHNVLRVSLQYDVAKQVDGSNMLLGELCMHVSQKKDLFVYVFVVIFTFPLSKCLANLHERHKLKLETCWFESESKNHC